jgi:hypothetical protein
MSWAVTKVFRHPVAWRLMSKTLLEDLSFLVTAQDIGRPSPPTTLPEGEGRFEPFGSIHVHISDHVYTIPRFSNALSVHIQKRITGQ